MTFQADIHIHTCLSPCADLEMSPSEIADTAKTAGLDMLGIADHNSVRNLPAHQEACSRKNIIPIFGIEVATQEEAHILCIFPDLKAAEEFGDFLYSYIPDIENDPERFGDQVVVDVDENVLDFEEKYLGSAAELSIDALFEEVTMRRGLFIPAHIDKPVFSIPSQLGFLPDMAYSAVEMTRPAPNGVKYPYPIICNSDSHYLEDIGTRRFSINSQSPGFWELTEALKAKNVETIFSVK
ncbi:MAG: PHP domain-containing protein [Spirochaetia bacterium]